MSGMVGRKLTHYEVLGQLGAGGMGEVYLAKDRKLGRQVALKLLPPDMSSDPERLERFQREVRALAALNHPNIVQVYSVDQSEDLHFFTMEVVQGESLDKILPSDGFSQERFFHLAVPLANALSAAHERGVTHRDLKPANILVAEDEHRIKIVDFGLAKLVPTQSGLLMSQLPTEAVTAEGRVLGTAPYMSPEQIEGKPVDHRTDVFSVGVVLYEMATGRHPFQGGSSPSIVSSILRDKPPSLIEVNRRVPRQLGRIIHRCLEKEPLDRFQSARDLYNELRDLEKETETDELFRSSGSAADPGVDAASSRRGVSWKLALPAGLALFLLGVASVWLSGAGRTALPPATVAPLRSEIVLDGVAPLALGSRAAAIGYDAPMIAISSDGRRLVYVSRTAGGTVLMLRDMTTGEVTPVAGTEGVVHAAFSPDGRSIAFLTNDRVKRTDVDGGGVVTLCEAQTPVLIWWPSGGFIFFTEDETWRLSRVTAAGPDERESIFVGDGQLIFSDILPGGRAALASVRNGIGGDFSDIVVVDMATGNRTRLFSSGFGARFILSGFLLFGRSGNLMAVPFDPATPTILGEPTIVATNVAMDSLFFQVQAASSDHGLLAYATGGDLAIGRLAWVGRIDQGSPVEYLPDEPRLYGALALAPDGRRLAVHVGDVQDYIWVSEIDGRRYRMQSSGPLGWPLWGPDGGRIAVRIPASGNEPGAYLVRAPETQRAGELEMPLTSPTGGPLSWSPVEDVLALNVFERSWQISFARIGELDSDGVFEGVFPEFSPDGRYVAYGSSRGTSAIEIYIRSYPEGRVSPPFSLDGGTEPAWVIGTGELFYRKGRKWYGAKVTTDPELHWEDVRLVFDTDFIDTPGMSYDVSPDGKRLLVVKRAEPMVDDRLQLLMNWPTALANRVR